MILVDKPLKIANQINPSSQLFLAMTIDAVPTVIAKLANSAISQIKAKPATAENVFWMALTYTKLDVLPQSSAEWTGVAIAKTRLLALPNATNFGNWIKNVQLDWMSLVPSVTWMRLYVRVKSRQHSRRIILQWNNQSILTMAQLMWAWHCIKTRKGTAIFAGWCW